MKKHVLELAEILDVPAESINVVPVGGGCISATMRVEVTRGWDGQNQCLFVKAHKADFSENFAAEADGLGRLASVGAIRVPSVVVHANIGDHTYLVLEWLPTTTRSTVQFEMLGQQLANLHQKSVSEQIGLDRNNFLGATLQLNAPRPTWHDFFANQRLRFQMDACQRKGLIDTQLQKSLSQVIENLDRLLAGSEPASSLLHGDLWSGNYLFLEDSSVAIIDPAVYYGCREAEFGMLRLFGACPQRFYDAYNEVWPLSDGWQQRVDVYILYHLLNHLNLFGRSYVEECRQIVSKILRRFR